MRKKVYFLKKLDLKNNKFILDISTRKEIFIFLFYFYYFYFITWYIIITYGSFLNYNYIFSYEVCIGVMSYLRYISMIFTDT